VTERYPGGELELFARARRWKAYLAAVLHPYLVGDVLEVGAGMGATTAALADGRQRRWLCLEPDESLVERLRQDVLAGRLPPYCQVAAGTLEDLPVAEQFDAILYIDVVEHILRDAQELASAARRLRPRGALAVLAPAHQWLYSPFDAAIGHHRRYTRGSLAAIAPPELEPDTLRYLDSVGLIASAANRLLLHRRLPTTRDIAVWDGWMIPVSRALDPLLRFRVGKSVLGVWRRPA
jgi:SAM-dependent methyltransferase